MLPYFMKYNLTNYARWGTIYLNEITNFQGQSNRSLKLATLWSSAQHIASIRCPLTMLKSGSMVLATKEEASSESLRPHQPLAGEHCLITCGIILL